MTVEEVRYYIVECDDCGTKHEHEDDDLDRLTAAITEDGWIVNREGQHSTISCPKCFERQCGMLPF